MDFQKFKYIESVFTKNLNILKMNLQKMVEISTINYQNLWWKHAKNFNVHDRDLSRVRDEWFEFSRQKIELKPGNIYVIKGPRQSGKTVLLKKTILELLKKNNPPRSIFYFACDSLVSRTRRELRRVLSFFLDMAIEFDKTYIFLDEITYVPDWSYELKHLVDSGLLSKTALVVTGSSPMVLKKEMEFLPGRGAERNEYFLKPLSFRDFSLQLAGPISRHVEDRELKSSLSKLGETLVESSPVGLDNLNEIEDGVKKLLPFKRELDFLFDIYLITGGFPKVANNYFKNRFHKGEEGIDAELSETFIRTILGDLSKHRKTEDIGLQILQSVSSSIGARISFSSLAGRLDGVTHPTIADYLETLEKSVLLQVIHSYDFEKRKIRPKANKKVYFIDPFLFYSVKSRIEGMDSFAFSKEFLMDERNKGKLIEGVVASHLSRVKEEPYIKEPDTFLWFYYDARNEIDFVTRSDEGYLGVEVKYQHAISPREIAKIDQIQNYLILTRDIFESKNNFLFAPISAVLVALKRSDKNL